VEENTTDQSQNTNQVPPISPVIQTPTTEPVSNNAKPKPKFPLALIMGIIIFLLVVGSAAGFYVYKQQSLKATIPTPTPAAIVSTSPSPTPSSTEALAKAGDPTDGWKTYNGVGFTFKYPGEFSTENCPKELPPPSICSKDQYTGSNPLSYFILASVDSNLPKNYKYESTEINGLQAYKTTGYRSLKNVEAVFFKRSESVYLAIIFGPFDKSAPFLNQEKFYTIFMQSLSTLKFSNSQNPSTRILEEQAREAKDAQAEAVSEEFINASIRFSYSNHEFPWDKLGNCQDSAKSSDPSGIPLKSIVSCTMDLIRSEELKQSFLATSDPVSSSIFISESGNSLNVCYKPSSQKEQLNPVTQFTSLGKKESNCKSNGGKNDCYRCMQ